MYIHTRLNLTHLLYICWQTCYRFRVDSWQICCAFVYRMVVDLSIDLLQICCRFVGRFVVRLVADMLYIRKSCMPHPCPFGYSSWAFSLCITLY